MRAAPMLPFAMYSVPFLTSAQFAFRKRRVELGRSKSGVPDHSSRRLLPSAASVVSKTQFQR